MRRQAPVQRDRGLRCRQACGQAFHCQPCCAPEEGRNALSPTAAEDHILLCWPLQTVASCTDGSAGGSRGPNSSLRRPLIDRRASNPRRPRAPLTSRLPAQFRKALFLDGNGVRARPTGGWPFRSLLGLGPSLAANFTVPGKPQFQACANQPIWSRLADDRPFAAGCCNSMRFNFMHIRSINTSTCNIAITSVIPQG